MELSMCLFHHEDWHHSLNLVSVDYPKVAASLITHNHRIEDLLVILLEFGLQIFVVVDRPTDELIGLSSSWSANLAWILDVVLLLP